MARLTCLEALLLGSLTLLLLVSPAMADVTWDDNFDGSFDSLSWYTGTSGLDLGSAWQLDGMLHELVPAGIWPSRVEIVSRRVVAGDVDMTVDYHLEDFGYNNVSMMLMGIRACDGSWMAMRRVNQTLLFIPFPSISLSQSAAGVPWGMNQVGQFLQVDANARFRLTRQGNVVRGYYTTLGDNIWVDLAETTWTTGNVEIFLAVLHDSEDFPRAQGAWDNFHCTASNLTYKACGSLPTISLVCANDRIQFSASDPNGIFGPGLALTVRDTHYTYFYPEITWNGSSTYTYTPSHQRPDGQTIHWCVDAVTDRFGNARLNTCFDYTIDHSTAVQTLSPTDGTVLNDSLFAQTITMTDAHGWTLANQCTLWVEGTAHVVGGGRLTWSAPNFVFTPAVPWSRPDTVHFTFVLHAGDGACTNYRKEQSWLVYVNRYPTASLVDPPPNFVTACSTQTVTFFAEDEWGLDPTAFQVTVNGSPMTWPNQMAWDAGTGHLTWTPPVPILDGATRTVCLTAAEDNPGLPVLTLPICTNFLVDRSFMVIDSFYPSQETVLTTSVPVIWWAVHDLYSPLDTHQTVLYINDTLIYHIGDPGLTFVGGKLIWDAAAAGIGFGNGDTVEAVPGFYDHPMRCNPNIRTHFLRFYIGERAAVRVTPSAIMFDSVGVGWHMNATVSVCNVGTLPMTVDSVRLGSTVHFSVTPTMGGLLDPGECIVYTIRFEPQWATYVNTYFRIYCSDPYNPAPLINLTGRSVLDHPVYIWSPSPGAKIFWDDTLRALPFSRRVLRQTTHRLAAAVTASVPPAGFRYRFRSWTPVGDSSRSIYVDAPESLRLDLWNELPIVLQKTPAEAYGGFYVDGSLRTGSQVVVWDTLNAVHQVAPTMVDFTADSAWLFDHWVPVGPTTRSVANTAPETLWAIYTPGPFVLDFTATPENWTIGSVDYGDSVAMRVEDSLRLYNNSTAYIQYGLQAVPTSPETRWLSGPMPADDRFVLSAMLTQSGTAPTLGDFRASDQVSGVELIWANSAYYGSAGLNVPSTRFAWSNPSDVRRYLWMRLLLPATSIALGPQTIRTRVTARIWVP